MGVGMRQVLCTFGIVAALATPAYAGPKEDSQALFATLIQGSGLLAQAINQVNPTPTVADELQASVYVPVDAARQSWLDAGIAFGSGDDNPYRTYAACSTAADELVYATVEIMRFHRGMSAELVKFEHTDPFAEQLKACATLIAD